MSVIGNGSAQLSFSEVLPASKDTAVFNPNDFMSKQIGGKKRTQKRKQKGGNSTPALDFSTFTPDNSAPVGGDNPTINAALNTTDLVPSNSQSPDVVPDVTSGGSAAAAGNPAPTNPSISVGGKRRSKRKRRSSKYSKRKGGARKRRSNKKSKKNSKKST